MINSDLFVNILVIGILAFPFAVLNMHKKGIYAFYTLSFLVLFMIRMDFLLPDIYMGWESYAYDLLLISLLPFISKEAFRYLDNKILIFLGIVILVSFLSFLRSGNHIFTYLLWLRGYFKYLILFFFILSMRPFDFKKVDTFFQKTIYIFFIIQIVISLYQIFVLRVDDPDYAAGTIGSLNFLLVGFVMLAYFTRRFVDGKLNIIPFASLILFILFLFVKNDTKSGVLLLIPVGAITYFSCVKDSRSAKRIITQVVIVLLVLFGSTKLVDTVKYINPKARYVEEDFFTRGQAQAFVRRDHKVLWVGRVASYKIASDIIIGDPVKLIFGVGNTAMFNSFLPQYDGYLMKKLGYSFYLVVPNLLVGMGITGTLLMLIFYFRIYQRVGSQDIVFKTVVLIFIISAFFNNTWTDEFYNYFLWGMLAIYLRKSKHLEKEWRPKEPERALVYQE